METQIANTDFEQLAEKYLQICNEHDASALARLYTEDAIFFTGPSNTFHGRKEIEQTFSNYFRAFPDLKLQFISTIPSGDQVCYEFHETGTFTAPLSTPEGDVPPTGRKFDIMGAFLVKLTADGLISVDRSYFDQELFQNQLGLSGKVVKEQEMPKAEVPNIEKEKAAVSERIDQWFKAAQEEDVGMLENILCDDAELLIFGTDAHERWIGKNDFIAAQKEFFKVTSDSRIEIYNKTVQISQTGTVAWASCMINLDIPSVDNPLHVEDLRFTSTFEKRDNSWVLVQGHASRPVS